MKRISVFLSIFILLCFGSTRANNVQITNVTTTTAGAVTQLNFTISWQNSWRGGPANNYDAVWVFVKYFADNNVWSPLKLTGNDIVAPTSLTATVGSDKTGVFIYRSADGSGNIANSNISLGIQQQSGKFSVKVFGLEMVYIPQGPFYAGNAYVGGLGAHIFGNGSEGGGPFLINSAYPPTMGSSPGYLYNFWAGGGTYYPNANFPTGFNPYYIMKYELSQGGYRDFLNSINNVPNQYLPERADVSANADFSFTKNTPVFNFYNRNTLRIVTTTGTIGNDLTNNGVYNEPGDGEWAACGSLLWSDAAAFLDWACLRPMTELEYEKAANGPDIISYPQFATGTFLAPPSAVTITNPFTNAESLTKYTDITNYINVLDVALGGPLRNGFLANDTSDRKSSGGSYYGVMELSGNLWEPTVTLADAAGRSFTGNLGDGFLSVYNARANQPTWPGTGGDPNSANTVGEIAKLDTAGISMRGGSFKTPYQLAITSVVNNPNAFPNSRQKAIDYGCRGVRQP